MRITCNSLDSFYLNLRDLGCSQKIVFFTKSYISQTEDDWREATSVEVRLTLTTVVNLGEGEALLECVMSTGIWRRTADGDDTAELVAKEMELKLHELCESVGCVVLPGILDLS